MQPTKNLLFTLISFLALLIAALFYLKKEAPLKPAQLNFTQNNKIAPVEKPTEVKAPEAVAPSAPKLFAPPEAAKWMVFEEVLLGKNDNDPRINSELRELSQSTHSALYERYDSIAPENRNGRGLVVFLISRNLKSAVDIDFLKKVYQEQPCLGLDDCKNTGSADPHFSGLNQTTLNYPQLAGLYQIEQQLHDRPALLADPVMKDGILFLLKQAENFPVPQVQQKATEIRKRYNL